MKKLFSLLFFLISFSISSFADFTVLVPHQQVSDSGVEVFIFDGLGSAEITYNTDGAQPKNLRWKEYTTDPGSSSNVDYAPNSTSITLKNIDISDATGYILEEDGINKYYIYVFNYNNYATASAFNSVETDCDRTVLSMNVTVVNPMKFYGPGTGASGKDVGRTPILKYNTLTRENQGEEQKPEMDTLARRVVLSPPMTNGSQIYPRTLNDIHIENTEFTLFGDQYAEFFNSNSTKTTTEAKKIYAKAYGVITPLDATNQFKDQDSELYLKGAVLKGAAPADVTLSVETNLSGNFYRWRIYNVNSSNASVGQSTEPVFQYTFSAEGTYCAVVEVTTMGDRCVGKDSISISIGKSSLEVPNVFTPNGDGMNDEFCVGFKSIVKFEIWVYNRWGRLVFNSTNPANCWDGYIGNAKAATGAYFYTIQATGADGVEYKGKAYSGSINLLR